MREDLYLKIKLCKPGKSLVITGNKYGFELLIDYSFSIIGKHTPAGHQHLIRGFGNVTQDSDDSVIYFSDDERDYAKTLKGKDYRFKIIYEDGEVVLMGDKKGLESFAELCLKVVREKSSVKLNDVMPDLMPGSLLTNLEFRKSSG